MFLHAGTFHILFNMLALWMFGVELERTGGSRYFAKFYALYFPSRVILMFFVFPVPVRYAVAIMGGMALLASIDGSNSGVASTAHLGGLLAGYLYLKGGRIHFLSEIKYRYLKWRINRMRRKF